MVESFMKKINIVISCALIFQFVACGTIMYPERRGQRGGRIDPGVAVLDAIGLFFFIIPGVIAFAVDFSTGAIYLPRTSRSSLDTEDLREVKFDPKDSSRASIMRIINKETGYDIGLDQKDMKVIRLESTDDMMAHFAEVYPKIKNSCTALSMK